jgi:hypothetical protein
MSGGFNGIASVCNGNSQGVDPTNTRGTAVTSGNNAYGSYAQIVASTPSDTAFIKIDISTNASSNTGFGGGVKIAIGGAGSEIDIILDLQLKAPLSAYYGGSYLFPVSIPAGTRIAAAANGNAGASDVYYVHVELFDSGWGTEDFAGVDSIGATNSGSRGTAVTAGAAATKGSYAQLTASTPRDYDAIALVVTDITSAGMAGDRWLIDLAIGGAGSEVIILPDWFISTTTSDDPRGQLGCVLPISIPAGTRVAARVASALGSNLIGIVAYGLYQ